MSTERIPKIPTTKACYQATRLYSDNTINTNNTARLLSRCHPNMPRPRPTTIEAEARPVAASLLLDAVLRLPEAITPQDGATALEEKALSATKITTIRII